MTRIFNFLFFLTVLTYASHFLWTDYNESQQPIKKFSELWQQDLDYLSTLKGFPKWTEIKNISFVTGNHLSRSLLFQTTLPKQIAKNSNQNEPQDEFVLEIVVIAWTEKKESGAVIQYELLDSKTKNKLWEFSRTLIF